MKDILHFLTSSCDNMDSLPATIMDQAESLEEEAQRVNNLMSIAMWTDALWQVLSDDLEKRDESGMDVPDEYLAALHDFSRAATAWKDELRSHSCAGSLTTLRQGLGGVVAHLPRLAETAPADLPLYRYLMFLWGRCEYGLPFDEPDGRSPTEAYEELFLRVGEAEAVLLQRHERKPEWRKRMAPPPRPSAHE